MWESSVQEELYTWNVGKAISAQVGVMICGKCCVAYAVTIGPGPAVLLGCQGS